MVRLRDVAEKANVSTATVSNVINNSGSVGSKTKKRVLQVIEDLDYKPNIIAKNLKTQKTNTIGVIVEDLAVFNAPEIIDGINQYAEENGYSILLTNMRLFKKHGNKFPDIKECQKMALPLFRQLLENRVEGIIYVGIHSRNVAGVLQKTNIPVVYTYCYTTNEEDYCVNYDDDQSSYEVTKYLINKGHKEIGLISGLINSHSGHSRFNGYRRALMDHELEFNPSLVKEGDWEYETGYVMAKELLTQSTKPTAIIAMNDLMAGGAIQVAKELEISLPNQLSIIGFDNREISNYYTPRLTTMALPLSEMGKKSLEILSNNINKQSRTDFNLVCKLIERDSVKKVTKKTQ